MLIILSFLMGVEITLTIDVESYVLSFFNPKGTQTQINSALKPSVERYKGKYKEALVYVQNIKEALGNAKQDNDEKAMNTLYFLFLFSSSRERKDFEILSSILEEESFSKIFNSSSKDIKIC